MKTRKPLISVVMSVRDNNFNYLETAINSILHQSYKLFEFIIVVDGSKQSVINIINLYKSQDDRIKIILTNQIGLTAALNLAIKSSQGKYIARQDYDDISLPNRLEEQFFFLENNTEYIFWYFMLPS